MPATTPPSRPQDLVLHIGTGKTGTSSIQFFLRDNRERLGELGLLYPRSPGMARHSKLSLFFKSDAELERSPEWPRQKQRDPTTFRRVFRRRFFSEIERAGLSRMLLSDEVLYGLPEPSLRRLRRFTDRMARSLRLVAYLRRQDDHLVSRYQQGVKIGWVVRLDAWIQQDESQIYDYAARLGQWERLVDPTELVVRRYEPGAFAAGSLHQDFLDAVGIDARAAELAQVPDRNISLDAESVEFLRLLNLYLVEHEAAIPGQIDHRALVKQLAAASAGPVLTLPGETLDRFMAQWEEGNRAVAREWFADASGELFGRPRRTRHTTTDQRLDPARLDLFLEISELPEPVHAPLRAIAEREAGAR